MLSKLTNFINGNHFFKHVLFLAGGTVTSQLIVLLSSPIITRLFSPEEFGEFAIYMSLISLLSVIATMRYEMAIPLSKNSRSAINTFVLSLSILVIFNVGLITILYIEKQNAIFHGLLNQRLIELLPLGIFVLSISQVLRYFRIGQNNFKIISISSIVQSFGMVGSQIVTGLLNLGSLGLVLGFIVGRLTGIASLFLSTKISFRHVNMTRVVTSAIRHKKFPKYTAWASLINVAGMQATPLIFTYYFNISIAGMIALTMRVLAVPSVLVGQSIGQVFYRQAAYNEMINSSNTELVLKLCNLLGLIGLPVFGFVGIYGSQLFSFVFGSEWSDAGLYAQYFSPWLLLSFISSPVSTFALVKGRQSTSFLITVYESFFRILVLFLGAKYLDVTETIMLFSILGVFISLFYIIWVLRISGSSFWGWMKDGQVNLGKASIFILLLVIEKQIPISSLSLLIAVTTVVIYYLILLSSIVNNFKLEN